MNAVPVPSTTLCENVIGYTAALCHLCSRILTIQTSATESDRLKQQLLVSTSLACCLTKIWCWSCTAACLVQWLNCCHLLQVLAAISVWHMGRASPLCHQSTALADGFAVCVLGSTVHCCHCAAVAREQSRNCVDADSTNHCLVFCPHVWQLVSRFL